MGRVLVTGGTGVLGSALTRELCAQNFEVVVFFRSNQGSAEQLAHEAGCVLHQGDASDENEVETLFQRYPFDAVVHLAGWNRDGLLIQTSPTHWNEIIRSHLDSSFLMCCAALRYLPSGGQLLLVSSRVGLRGSIGQSAYGAAKAGVLGLMKSAALEGRQRNVRINALCPGFAPSPGDSLSKKQRDHRQSEELLPKNDAAQSFAAFTTWFLSSNSQATGQILRPDCRI